MKTNSSQRSRWLVDAKLTGNDKLRMVLEDFSKLEFRLEAVRLLLRVAREDPDKASTKLISVAKERDGLLALLELQERLYDLMAVTGKLPCGCDDSEFGCQACHEV